MEESFEPHVGLRDSVSKGESDSCAKQRNADAQEDTIVERLPIVGFGEEFPDILQCECRTIFCDETGFEHLKQRKHHEQDEQYADENDSYQDGGFTPQTFPINERFSRHHRKASCTTANQLSLNLQPL